MCLRGNETQGDRGEPGKPQRDKNKLSTEATIKASSHIPLPPFMNSGIGSAGDGGVGLMLKMRIVRRVRR